MNGIRLLALDVDGVLTDGSIYVDSDGRETIRFNVHDGSGIRRWLLSGRECVWITGRSCPAVLHRARNLSIRYVLTGAEDKVSELETLLDRLQIEWSQIAYVGDDTVDLEAIRRAGIGVAVANAVDEVKAHADMVTNRQGGQGAVREVVDYLLSHDR